MKNNLLFVFLLIFLVCAGGCNQKQETFQINSPIDGLHWGMSEKEVINSLNLADNSTRSENGQSVSIITKEQYNLFGATVNLYISIYDDMLVSIIAKINEDDLKIVEETLNNELGPGDYQYYEFGTSVKDLTSISWRDTPLKDNPEYLQIFKQIYSDKAYDRFIDSIEYRSLITYELNLDKKSAKYALLSIDGSLAAFVNYPAKANKTKVDK